MANTVNEDKKKSPKLSSAKKEGRQSFLKIVPTPPIHQVLRHNLPQDLEAEKNQNKKIPPSNPMLLALNALADRLEEDVDFLTNSY